MMSPSPEPWYTEKSVEGTDVIARLNDLRWEVERLKDEKEGLERTLLNLRWGKDAALDENASLRAENETLQDENASLRAENETLRAKLITSYQDKDDKQVCLFLFSSSLWLLTCFSLSLFGRQE